MQTGLRNSELWNFSGAEENSKSIHVCLLNALLLGPSSYPIQPKVTAMLSTALACPSSTLPWSLLLPQGPHLQDVSRILHPDSNQVLGDTEMLVVLIRRRTQARCFLYQSRSGWRPSCLAAPGSGRLTTDHGGGQALWPSREDIKAHLDPGGTPISWCATILLPQRLTGDSRVWMYSQEPTPKGKMRV